MREKWVIWTGLNDEQDAIAEALGADCVSIQGSTPDDERERMHEAWLNTDVPVLVTKIALFGHGLNWQHCSKQIFLGVSHSFEAFYQGCRRSWRFGQQNPVDVHVISSELEGNVVANLKAKQAKAEELTAETRGYVSRYVRAEVVALERQTLGYVATEKVVWPPWLRSENT